MFYFQHEELMADAVTVAAAADVINSTTALSSSVTRRPIMEEVHGQIFDVGPRYINLSYIGEGAYGMVV
jgi:hypothetical protein